MKRHFFKKKLVFVLIVIPIAAARFVEFKIGHVPFWLTIAADFIFNLNGLFFLGCYVSFIFSSLITFFSGLFNVILFSITYRRIRQASLVDLSAPRRSLSATTYGITPYLVRITSNTDEKDIEKGQEKPETSPTIRSFYTSDSAPPEMTEVPL